MGDIVITPASNDVNSTAGTLVIRTSDAQAMSLKTNDTDRIFIASAGKVGIGTATNISGVLHVHSPDAGDQTLLVLHHSAGYATNTENRLDFFDDETHKIAARIAQYYSAETNNRWGLKFYTNSQTAINSIPALTLLGRNAVGIGTANPNGMFHVHCTQNGSGEVYFTSNTGNINQNNDSPKLILAGEYQTAGVSLQAVNVAAYGRKDLVILQHDANDYVTAYEAMRLSYGGTLTLNATNKDINVLTLTSPSSATLSNNAVLDISRGGGAHKGSAIRVTSANYSDSNKQAFIELNAAAYGGVNTRYINCYDNDRQSFVVLANARVGIGTASPGAALEVSGSAIIGSSTYGSSYGHSLRIPFASDNLTDGTLRGHLQFDSVEDYSVNGGDAWKWKLGAVARPGNAGNYNSQFEILRSTRVGVTDNPDFVINRDGNIGIGMRSPTNKIQISGGGISFTTSTGLAVQMIGIVLPTNIGYIGPYNSPADGNSPTVVALNHAASVQQTWFYSSGRIAMSLNREGRFHIGNLNNAPNCLLSVGPTSATTAVSGMCFGNDASANLYRSAASTITTDGSLTVVGGAVIGVSSAYNSSIPLQVKDNLLIGSSYYTFATIGTSSTGDLILTSNAYPANVGANTNIIFKLGTSAGGGPEERMRIVSNGNVGIGITNPETTSRLHIKNLDAAAKVTIESADGSESFINFSAQSSEYSIGFVRDGSNVNSLRFCAADGLSAGEVMRLQNTNVGIGTTVPAYRLDIEGASTTSVVQNVRNPSLAWNQYALTRYQTDTKNSRYVDVGYFRGVSNEDTRGFVISGLNSNILTLLDIVGGYNLGLGGVTAPLFNIDAASTQGKGIQLRYDTSTAYRAQITPYWNSSTDTRIDFAINRTANVTPDVIMSVGYGGNVGIGTTSPSSKLDVNGIAVMHYEEGQNQYSFRGANRAINDWDSSGLTNNPQVNSYLDGSWFIDAGGSNDWSRGILSKRRFRRVEGLTLEYESFTQDNDTGGVYTMIGFVAGDSVQFSYCQQPSNLIYQANTSLLAYTNCADSGSDYSFDTRNAFWRFKTVLKGTGALHYVYRNNKWNLIKETSVNNQNDYEYLRVLVTLYRQRVFFRDVKVYVAQESFRGSNYLDNVIGNLFVSGSVGIGTTNPTQKLDVVGGYGAPDDDGGILKIKGPGVGPTQLNFGVSADGGYGWIQTTDVGASNERNIILNPLDGNVGIGTTNPLSLLGVGAASSTTAANGITFGGDASANLYRLAAGQVKTDGQLVAVGGFYSSATAGNYIETLNIGTAVIIEGGATEGLYLGDSSRWLIGTSDAAYVANADGDLHFRDNTNSVTRMIINYASGFVGIGATSPLEKLQVQGNIYATDGALFNFKAQRIPLQGAPQQGTHKGYLILAKAYTSGFVEASYVIGKVILRRGTSGTGHNVDIYEVNSSRGYNTEIFQVSRLGAIGTRFVRLVKVTYGGVVYHAIETSSDGGEPSTEMYFEGSIIDSPLIFTDATFVSNVTAFGDGVIFVDQSSNVGIGATSPTQKLDIVGSYGAPDDNAGMLKIRGPGVGPTQLNFGVSADGGYGWIQATDIAVDNDRDIILAPLGGKVGIGTTSTIEKLHVLGNIHIQSESDSLGGGGLYLGISNSRNIAIRQTSTNKNFAIDTYNASESWQNRITILNAGGNFGIGTTNPLAPLHVGLGGDWPSSTGTSAMVFIKQKSSNVGLVIQEPGNASFDRALHLYTNGSLATIDATYRDTGPYPDIAFVTSGTERVRINSAGNVLIRTTTSTTNGGLLQIGQVPNTTASSIGFNNEDNAVISAKYNLVFQIDNTNSVASRAYEWKKGGKGYGDGTNLMTLNAAGKLGIGTASPTTLLSVGSAGSTSAASGITFGGDAEVNLYRVSENVLQTDAALNVVGSIYSASYFYTAVGQIYGSTYGNLTFFVGNSAGNAWQEGMFIKRGSYVGIGTTNPTGKLHIVSSVAGETVLRADGTNGTLFTVVDDLSDSLMSVNNSAGLPVLEVFADDRVVAGQYGSGDFVLINNKVGLGTSNPANKLTVIGAASIGSSTYNIAAPANGLIVQGTVGIGLTNPTQKLHVKSSVGQDGVMIDALQYSEVAYKINGSAIKSYLALTSIAGGYVVGSSANSFIIRNDTDIFMTADAGVTSNITIKNNGNVGIGLTNPSDKFVVNGNIGFSGDANRYILMPDVYQGVGSIYMQAGFGSASAGGAIKLHGHNATTYVGGDVEVGLSQKGDFLINDSIGGSSRLVTVKQNGNVGIGTITPSGKLHIGTASYNSSNRPLIVNNGVQTVNARLYDTAVIQQDDVTTLRLVERNAAVANQILSFSIGDGVARIACTAQPMQFYVNGGDAIGDYGYLGLNGTKAIEISTTANVGIGNVTPSAARLHIKGDGFNPVLRVETALLQGAAGGTAGKTFVGWMPIQTGALSPGDTVYIPLYK